MSKEQVYTKQKTLVTEGEHNKAVTNERQDGEMAARIEVGEWIKANMLNSPKENPYSAIFPYLAKHLKEGKRL